MTTLRGASRRGDPLDEEVAMKPFTHVAIAVFALVALLQLVRVLMGWDVSIAGVAIPAWASVVAFLVAAMLAVMLRRELRR
jgi:hypothetical protein